MIVTIICLIIGILGFVKGRINVTAKKELRAAPMYVASTLFCLPLPLSFLVGIAFGVSHATSGTPLDTNTLMIVAAIATWGPIVAAVIVGFAMAQPKAPPPSPAQGFEVKM